MEKYRDRLQIIADILSITNRHVKKTQIMYQANLSYRLLCRYLKEVTDAGFVSLRKGEYYALTAKGRAFLTRYEIYSRNCENLEQHLNHVNHEKTVLEKMCSNANRFGKNRRSLEGKLKTKYKR